MSEVIPKLIESETDTEFKEYVHIILYELNKISPNLLQKLVPYLENEIKVKKHHKLFLFSQLR